MVLSAGERLGPYEILSPLGSGGMGEVYRARDPRLDREVAVKVLPRALASSPDALARFEREARVVAALSHPNILAIHDFGVEGGVPFAVAELLDGETLKQRILRAPLTVREAVDIGAAIADGLAAAHGKGIVHRDLKPENIFLTSDGRVKILDFGLARREAPLSGSGATSVATAHALTEPGTILGTLGYMSPEQVRGQATSPASDIFSLGCVLHEMLAGQPAFARGTAADTLAAVLNEEPAELSRTGRDVPASLEAAIRRCLRKNTGERFESARDLAFALRSVLRESLASAPVSPRSVAVLPFTDMSPQKDQDYLCDGIAEEIITALTKVPDLRVVGRTSAFAFRGGAADAREIGRRLNVATLLDGSVRKAGERIRVTAQLVNVADGYQLWSERFDRELVDVFAIQDEISLAIVEQLRASLLGTPAGHLVRKATDDPGAYADYLRGRHHWNRQTGENLAKAIDYFERAISADPSFAAAHVGLADSYILLINWGVLPPTELPRALSAAMRAVELDVSVATAHSALGVIHAFTGDWARSDAEHRRAEELGPGDANVRMLRAMSLLAPTGRVDEAIAAMERAEKLDPVSPFIAICTAAAHYVARRYDRGHESCARALELDSRFPLAHWSKGLIEIAAGDPSAAVASFERACDLMPEAPFLLGDLGRAYAAAGRTEDARRVLADLTALSRQRYVSPLNFAFVLMSLGEADEAFLHFDRAVATRSEQIYWLKVSPRFDALRSDPRFPACVRRLGLEA